MGLTEGPRKPPEPMTRSLLSCVRSSNLPAFKITPWIYRFSRNRGQLGELEPSNLHLAACRSPAHGNLADACGREEERHNTPVGGYLPLHRPGTLDRQSLNDLRAESTSADVGMMIGTKTNRKHGGRRATQVLPAPLSAADYQSVYPGRSRLSTHMATPAHPAFQRGLQRTQTQLG